MNRIYRKNIISVVLLFALLFSNLTTVFADTTGTDTNGTATTQTQEIAAGSGPSMVIEGTSETEAIENEIVDEKAEQPVITSNGDTPASTLEDQPAQPVPAVTKPEAQSPAKAPAAAFIPAAPKKVSVLASAQKEEVLLLSGPVAYQSDAGSVEFTTDQDTSTNAHTIIQHIWYQQGDLYVAVNSTHSINQMAIGNEPGTLVAELGAGVNITLDGKTLNLTGPRGNVKDSHWTIYSWTSQQLDQAGSNIVTVPGINQGSGGHTITAALAVANPPAPITITAVKTWVGGQALAGPVKVQLKKQIGTDGTPVNVGTPKTVTKDSDWKAVWQDLPRLDSFGRTIIYTITESDIPDRFTAEVQRVKAENGDLTFTITNTYVTPRIAVTAEKVWQGGSTLKTPIVVELRKAIQGGAPAVVGTQELNEANSWSHTWADQPATDSEGNTYLYTLKEMEAPMHFAASVTQSESAGGNIKLTLTNTYQVPVLHIEATKFWAGGQALSNPITVVLTRSVKEAAPVVVDTAILDENNSWFKEWMALPKTDPEGNVYYYDLNEINVPEFFTSETSRVEDPAGDLTFIITNTYTAPKITAAVHKSWVGGSTLVKPVSVVLSRKIAGGTSTPLAQVVLNAGNNWRYTWTGLDKMDAAGTPYLYELTELNGPANFTAETVVVVDEAGNLQFHLTNTFVSPKRSISVTKTWIGGPADKPAITLNLLADGQEVREKVLSGASEYMFTDLPVLNPNGTVINYTVTEDPVTGYASTIKGFAVTNTWLTGTRDFTVQKIWQGGPQKRPDITINLMADGKDVDKIVLKNGKTEHTFKNLPIYKLDGSEIVYAISENYVPGYISSIEGFTATNRFDVGSRDIKVIKIWEGGISPRPTITIHLLADGVPVDSKELPAGDTEYTFTGLPVYKTDGTAIVYTVAEDAVDNYLTTIEDFTIFNTWGGELPYTGTSQSGLPVLGLILALGGLGLILTRRSYPI